MKPKETERLISFLKEKNPPKDSPFGSNVTVNDERLNTDNEKKMPFTKIISKYKGIF